MKKIIALILALMMSVSSISAMALGYGEEWNNYRDNGTQVYKDVPPTHWGYNAINRVSATQWFSGYPDGTFRPDAQITREEAMKVIVSFLGLELKETVNSSYYDVAASRWSSPYIEAGKLLFPKIETYNGQNPFQPDMPIKREDIMYAMVIAKKYNNEVKFVDQSVLNMFDDANSISANVKPYVALAVNIGLVAGKGTSIGAQDPLTRAEFATLLYRATYIGDGTGGGLSDMSEEEPVVEIVGVELTTPITSELTIGESMEVTAKAIMSDGSEVDYSDKLNPYNSNNNNAVLMNKNVITAVNAGSAVIKFNGDSMLADKYIVITVKAAPVEDNDNNNNSDNDRDNNDRDNDDRNNDNNRREDDEEEEVEATLTKLSWSVDALDLNEGDTSKIKLIGKFSDGTEKDLTKEYEIYSSDEDVVEVSASGKVTAVGVGDAVINMNVKRDDDDNGGVMGVIIPNPLSVVVKGAERNEIKSLEWSTDEITLSVDEAKTIKLYAVYADGSKEDVTEDCVVYAMDEEIAVVDGNEITGISEGKTKLWFESMPAVGISLPKVLSVTVE